MAEDAPAPGPAGVLVPQWLLITIALGVIIARLHLRINIKKQKLQRNDITMIIAWFGALAIGCIDARLASLRALQPHVSTILDGYEGSPDDIQFILRIFWASSFPFLTSFYFSKMTLLLLYIQLFPHFMVKRRVFLWCTIIFVNVAFVLSLLALVLPCMPVERNWTMDPERLCPSDAIGLIWFITWSLHLIGDLLIFALPWMVIPGLQLELKMRLIIYFTFGLGVVNIAACIVRAVVLLNAQTDFRVSLSTIELWSALDLNISLVVSCLPSLGAYFRKSSRGSSATERRQNMNQPRSQHGAGLGGGRAGNIYRKIRHASAVSSFGASLASSASVSGRHEVVMTLQEVGSGGDSKRVPVEIRRRDGDDSDIELVQVQSSTTTRTTPRKGSDTRTVEHRSTRDGHAELHDDGVVVFQRRYHPGDNVGSAV